MAETQTMDQARRAIFGAAYSYRQAFLNATGGAATWERAAEAMQEQVARLGNHPLAQALFVACYEDIEREYLENRRAKE